MNKVSLVLAALLLLCTCLTAQAGVTGNPLLDGWNSCGNSLENGVYVRNSANYGFDTYTARMTVSSGSNLEISDGANSWLVGDTVLGVGGKFHSITAAEAGWAAFTGNAVNSILGEDTKFVAKFGAANATFAASTVAPSAGNGLGSMGSNGGAGAIQVRTSGWIYGYTPLPGDTVTWSSNSGQLTLLDDPGHIERNGSPAPDADVARLIWIWDANTGHVDSWQILLNTSLVSRLDPTWTGIGDKAIASVQRRDGVYTDALVTFAPVPEPSSLVALFGGMGALLAFRRRRA